MWSFYILAIMFSLKFIESIVKFGSVKVHYVTGNQKASSFVLLLGVFYILWDFFEPLNHDIGLIIFSIMAIQVLIKFIKHLNKPTITTNYDYLNFFNSLGYVVLIVLYQIWIK